MSYIPPKEGAMLASGLTIPTPMFNGYIDGKTTRTWRGWLRVIGWPVPLRIVRDF